MKPVLIKITCDLYAPGSILSPTTVKWLTGQRAFHSRRFIYPEDALFTYTIPAPNKTRIVSQDFFHMRFSSMDAEYLAPFDSGADYIWSVSPLETFFGEDLHRMAAWAMNTSHPYKDGRTYAAWMELWEYDEERKIGKFIIPIDFNILVEKIKTPR